MTPYRSKSGKASGVTAYEIAADRIKVRFNHGDVYTYTTGVRAAKRSKK